jgi:hypothetical protein
VPKSDASIDVRDVRTDPRVPAGVRAILDALRFDQVPRVDAAPRDLSALTLDDLAFADRSQLTLLLSRLELSAAARQHVNAALERNSIRVGRVAAAYEEIAASFRDAGVDHVVLKGFTHVPMLVDDTRLRVQYDLDLYVPSASRDAARDALLALGYQPISSMEGLAMDHLPTMIRKTGWQWRGDYFDPDLPIAVEVHFQFWDAPTECIRVEGLNDFWARRQGNQLNPIDLLGYAALHLTRHLLRGNVRAFHVWEIARFLNSQADFSPSAFQSPFQSNDAHPDPAFWRAWQKQHPRSLRQIEAVAFLLAKTWFACRVPDEAEVEINELPHAVHRWFEVYGWSPIETTFEPNKDELWLHLSLVTSRSDGWDVLRRRLIPASLPGPIDEIHMPDDRLTASRRVKRAMRNAGYAASRGYYHARMLIPTLIEGARWWFRARE